MGVKLLTVWWHPLNRDGWIDDRDTVVAEKQTMRWGDRLDRQNIVAWCCKANGFDPFFRNLDGKGKSGCDVCYKLGYQGNCGVN